MYKAEKELRIAIKHRQINFAIVSDPNGTPALYPTHFVCGQPRKWSRAPRSVMTLPKLIGIIRKKASSSLSTR